MAAIGISSNCRNRKIIGKKNNYGFYFESDRPESENPRTNAFSNLSFEIPRGKLTCITGENGVGKTTLIKHLLADLAHDYEEHAKFMVSRDQVQYVPQLRSIDDEYPLCIRDFAAFGLKTSSIFLNKKPKKNWPPSSLKPI